MRTMSIENMGFGFKRATDSAVPKTTAYYIFDKAEKHMYQLDAAHFRAMNGRIGDAVIGATSAEDVAYAAAEMVSTGGTIWDISTQFMEGASITIPDPKVAVRIYKHILKHLEGHLQEMRSNIRYDAPDLDDFRQLAEFATRIRPYAMMHDPELDKNASVNSLNGFMTARPVFRLAEKSTGDAPKKAEIPKSVRTLDAIERFMEICNNGG